MIRHEYETIYVTRPDLDSEAQARIDEKLQSIVGNKGGELLMFEQWGKRKLAYPIRKSVQGAYQYMHYVAPADLPIELERNMNLEDSLIRYITVRLGENVDVEEARGGAEAAQQDRVNRLGVNLTGDEDRERSGGDDDSDGKSDGKSDSPRAARTSDSKDNDTEA